MTRKRKPRLPHINNSGPDRTANNVFAVFDDDPRPPFEINFYETELQELAAKEPTWNIFVKEPFYPDPNMEGVE